MLLRYVEVHRDSIVRRREEKPRRHAEEASFPKSDVPQRFTRAGVDDRNLVGIVETDVGEKRELDAEKAHGTYVAGINVSMGQELATTCLLVHWRKSRSLQLEVAYSGNRGVLQGCGNKASATENTRRIRPNVDDASPNFQARVLCFDDKESLREVEPIGSDILLVSALSDICAF